MTFEKVKTVIADTLNCEIENLTMDTNLADDLGADSLDSVDLGMAIEDEFGVTIADEDLVNIKTVGDLVRYVEQHSGE